MFVPVVSRKCLYNGLQNSKRNQHWANKKSALTENFGTNRLHEVAFTEVFTTHATGSRVSPLFSMWSDAFSWDLFRPNHNHCGRCCSEVKRLIFYFHYRDFFVLYPDFLYWTAHHEFSASRSQRQKCLLAELRVSRLTALIKKCPKSNMRSPNMERVKQALTRVTHEVNENSWRAEGSTTCLSYALLHKRW